MRKEFFKAIIEAQKTLIKSLESEISTYNTSADLDEESTIDLDDMAQQANTSEQIIQIRKKLDMEREDLRNIKAMEFLDAQEVKKGAFVETKDFIFFFGYAFQPISLQSKRIIGVSPEAPAYDVNLGKVKGDYLQLNDNKIKIEAIC